MTELRRMTKNPPISPKRQLVFIFLSLFLYLFIFELFTRWMAKGPEITTLSLGLIPTVLFSLSITFLILAIIYLFPEKYHHIYANLWLFILFVLFMSQNIYHDIFRTFYFFQSVEHIGQGLGFRNVLYTNLIKNIWWILISLSIIVTHLFIEIRKRKNYVSNRFKWPTKIKFVIAFLTCFVSFHFLALWAVKSNEQARDLYYHNYATNLSVEKLGLFTTFRLDIQRNLLGWTPTIEEPDLQPEDEETLSKDQDEKEDAPSTDTPPEDYGVNQLEIPFDQLIEESSSDEIRKMHQYFKNKEASNKNEFTGKYEGYNLIWITAEGYAPYAVREDLTPSLYKLSREGYQFNNFYNPIWGVSTSDGEYTILNSLVPKVGVWSFSKSGENDLPFVMGNQLKELGYAPKAYHNHSYSYYDRDISHPNMGYDYRGVGNGLEMEDMWPRSDLEMMEKTIDDFIHEDPFHAYFMTVSGHLEYNFLGNEIAAKNKHLVDDLDLSDQAKAYIAGQIELDKALKLLLERLEEEDVLDDTLIVLTGDHYPYGLENETIEELMGESLDEKFGLYKSELILYASNMKEEEVEIDEPTSTLDILPTLSNLMGLDFDSRLFMGRDVFSEEEALVVFEDRSFLTEDFSYYLPSEDLTSFSGEPIDDEYFDHMQRKTDEIFYYSMQILDKDYYSLLKWKEKQD